MGARRQAEQDLGDTTEHLADLTVQNQGLYSAKRKLESDLADLKGEQEEAKMEAGNAEDRARRYMLDAAKLADELRLEQENAQLMERERRKQEARCRELEAELDSEQRRCGDAHKNFRKAERGIKEYAFKSEEVRKNAERMQVLLEKL